MPIYHMILFIEHNLIKLNRCVNNNPDFGFRGPFNLFRELSLTHSLLTRNGKQTQHIKSTYIETHYLEHGDLMK